MYFYKSQIKNRKFQKRSLSTGVPSSYSVTSFPFNRYTTLPKQHSIQTDKIQLPQIPSSTTNLLAAMSLSKPNLSQLTQSHIQLPDIPSCSFPVIKRNNIFRSNSLANVKTNRHSTDLDLLRQCQLLQKIQPPPPAPLLPSANNMFYSQQCVFVNPDQTLPVTNFSSGSSNILMTDIPAMDPNYSSLCFVNQPQLQRCTPCINDDTNFMTMSMPDDQMFAIGGRAPPMFVDDFYSSSNKIPFVHSQSKFSIDEPFINHPSKPYKSSTSINRLPTIPSSTFESLNAIKSSVPISSNTKLNEDYNKLYQLFEPSFMTDDQFTDNSIEMTKNLSSSSRTCGYCSDTSYEPLDLTEKPLRRRSNISKSQTLITEDQIINLVYDSDTGWKTKSVQKMEQHKPTPLHLKFQKSESSDSDSTRSGHRTLKDCDRLFVTKFDAKKKLMQKQNSRSQQNLSVSKSHQRSKDLPIKHFKCSQTNVSNDNDAPKSNECSSTNKKDNNTIKSNDNNKKDVKKLSNFHIDTKPQSNISNSFEKCKTHTQSITSSNNDSQSGSDDVFESPVQFRSTRFTKRRSSSLDDIRASAQMKDKLNKDKNNQSSVSINTTPQLILYEKCPDITDNNNIACNSSLSNNRSNSSSSAPADSVANNYDALKFSNAPGVAQLKTKPKRASLKKTSSSSTTTTTSTTTTSTMQNKTKSGNKRLTKKSNSSEYDVRDRGRGRNGNGRESYRDQAYREGSQDRNLSDREQRDPRRGSFNRSMSNAEAASDDKIGKTYFRNCFYLYVLTSFVSYTRWQLK